MTETQWFQLGKLTAMARLVGPLLDLMGREAHQIGLTTDARNLGQAATVCRLLLERLDPSDPEAAARRDELLHQQIVLGGLEMDQVAALELSGALADP